MRLPGLHLASMFSSTIRRAARFPVLLAAALVVLHLLGMMWPAQYWSVWPRDPSVWWGPVTFHLRHAGWGHLWSNLFPLVTLGTLGGMLYPKAMPRAWWVIWLGSGIVLWCIGRDGPHVGASALVYGLFHFIVGMALCRRDKAAVAGLFIAVLLFGGLALVLWAPAGVSWEGHLSGALCGYLAAWRLYRLDAPPAREPYSWEVEEKEATEAARLGVPPPDGY